jgi:hypothetical protein
MQLVKNLDGQPCSAEKTEGGPAERIHRSIHGLVHPNLHRAIRIVIINRSVRRWSMM